MSGQPVEQSREAIDRDRRLLAAITSLADAFEQGTMGIEHLQRAIEGIDDSLEGDVHPKIREALRPIPRELEVARVMSDEHDQAAIVRHEFERFRSEVASTPAAGTAEP